jgi:D-sedoheptulose 7-phosphate isomerase
MNKPEVQKFINDSLIQSSEVKRKIIDECSADIEKAIDVIVESLKAGKKLLLAGNGGSAADCQHIATELVIRFSADFKRPSIPAFAITTDTSNITAGGNDIGFDNTFARSVEGLGAEGDVLWAISTSGNSENLIRAIKMAKEKKMKVVSFLGNGGGKMKDMSDVAIVVPATGTARVQEGHITIAHIICHVVERKLY